MRIPQIKSWWLMVAVAIAGGPSVGLQSSCAGQAVSTAASKDEFLARDLADGIRMLKAEDSEIRAMGAKGLARLGRKAEPAISHLIAVLGDNGRGDSNGSVVHRTVGTFASGALRSIGPKAVPALIKAMLTNPDEAIRFGSTGTLIGFLDEGGEDEVILQALDRAAGDPDQKVRRLAVQGLGVAGPKAMPALAHLIELLKADPWEWVRFEAAISLAQVDPSGEKVTRSLIVALKDPDADVIGASAASLGRLGVGAKSAVPALMAALEDERDRSQALTPDFVGSRALRSDAAEALGRIGIEAKAAIPALRKMLAKDRQPGPRVVAALALSRIVPEDAGIIPAIIKEVERKGDGTAGPEAAISALAELGPKARAAVPALIRALEHESNSIRESAAEALGTLGDRSAIPALERFLKDENFLVRHAAEKSLEKLQAVRK